MPTINYRHFLLSAYWGYLLLGFAAQSLSSQSFSATVKHISVVIPNNLVQLDISGIPTTSSWTVGVMSVPGMAGAKLDALQGDLNAIKPTFRHLSNVAGVDPGKVSAKPGYFGLNISQDSPQAFGAFVRVPPGTEVKVTINGTLQSDSLVSSSVVLQDGVLRHDDLKSFQQLLSIIDMPERPAPPDVLAKNGKYYASYSAAKSHLSSLTKPSPTVAGCCGSSVRIVLDISVDANGNVTSVKRLSGASENVGALEGLVNTWKFMPFTYGNKAVPVEILLPLTYANNAVASPLF